MRRDLVPRSIRYGSLKSDVGRLTYRSYLFLLRAPSEGLPLFRASRSGILTAKLPKSVQSILGVGGLEIPPLNSQT